VKTLLVIAVVQVLNLVLFIFIHRVLLLRLLVLRHQIGVWKRSIKRPKLRDSDRLFWSQITRIWKRWRSELFIVNPETVIRWRRRKFREYWGRKSEGKVGRPSIPRKHIAFIRRISSDHPEYGEDRIALELELKFGILHSTATIRKYRVVRNPGPRDSQAWRTFLKNQAEAVWTCDFLVHYTLGFRVLHVFVLMELGSRKVVHFNVTEHPTLNFVKQQVRNACLEDLPKFLIHDNDGKYGQLGHPIRLENNGRKVSCRSTFDAWLFEVMNIRGIPTPYRAPNASAHVERLIGTLRRECLDHMLIWNERHLRRALGEFIGWYNHGRVHQGIHGIPDPGPEFTEPLPAGGQLMAIPILNGLHHDYRLVA
jgi:transposase InsO family protein